MTDRQHELINLYATGPTKSSNNSKTVPFIHPIELKNNTGKTICIRALFNDGAMTGAMCTTIF